MKGKSIRLMFSISLFFISLTMGCAKEEIITQFLSTFGDFVECTESDSTPPSIELVFDHPVTGKTIRLKSGAANMTISIKPTDRFFIMAVAEDLEGVKEIKTYSASAPQCESLNEIGCLVSSLSVPNTFKVGGGSAVTRLWLPVQMEVIGAKCPPECKLVSWRRGVFAEAVNCSGSKNSTPTASFTVKYP